MLEFCAAIVDILKHVKRGGGGGHENDIVFWCGFSGVWLGAGDSFLNGILERICDFEPWVGVASGKLLARFAQEDDVLDLGCAQNLVDFGEVFVVCFIATADDDGEIGVWEGVYGDASGGWVG